MLAAKYTVLYLLYIYSLLSVLKAATYYLITERPVIQYMSPRHISFYNITALRHGRRNPIYYVDMHVTTLMVGDNNLTFDIYFFEHMYNHYRRTFLEFHFRWCDLFLYDDFFASALRKNLPLKCPHLAGTYHLYNMTLDASAIPEAFPFLRGRLLVNASYRGEHFGSVYTDLELKKYKNLKI